MNALAVCILPCLQQEVDCLSCHESQGEAHAASIHRQKGISCGACHGWDTFDFGRTRAPHAYSKTFDPGRKLIVTCSKCHKPEAEFLEKGPHLNLDIRSGRRKVSNCLLCHDHHKTEEAAYGSIAGRCEGCHQREESGLAGVEKAMAGARQSARAAEDRVRNYRMPPGIDAKPELETAEDVRLGFASLRREQHAMDPGKIAARASELEKRRQEMFDGLDRKEATVRRRPYGLAGFLILMGVFGWAAVSAWRRRWI